MAKGRKRKAGNRHDCGKLKQDKPAVDRGTPEIQSRKAWSAGKGDQALTWHTIGILRAHDQLTEDQYRAACEYRRCFCLLYRRPDVPAVPMDGVARGHGGEMPDKILEIAKAKMERFEEALSVITARYGRAARDAWCNVVVYDRTPRWMMPVFQRQADVNDCLLFKKCIEAIEKAHMGSASV